MPSSGDETTACSRCLIASSAGRMAAGGCGIERVILGRDRASGRAARPPGEALRDHPACASRLRRGEQVVGTGVRSSLVAREGPVEVPQVEAVRQRSHLVDHDLGLGPGHGLADGHRVQAVDHDRLRAQTAQVLRLARAPGRARDLMAGLDELRHELPSDHSGRSGDEYSHDVPPCLLAFTLTQQTKRNAAG